jgi:hypothetical protein
MQPTGMWKNKYSTSSRIGYKWLNDLDRTEVTDYKACVSAPPKRYTESRLLKRRL